MSILLKLFWTFFKISLFTIGGGAAMIPLITQEVLANGWLSEEMLINLVGIAESTPGPIAVNVSTYIGASQAGFVGAVIATLGMVLPPFLIILVIAKFFKNFLNNRYVTATLDGVKPVIVGLIVSVGIYYAVKVGFPALSVANGGGSADWRAFGIFLGLAFVNLMYFIKKKKNVPPIAVIIASAVLGMIVYAI